MAPYYIVSGVVVALALGLLALNGFDQVLPWAVFGSSLAFAATMVFEGRRRHR